MARKKQCSSCLYYIKNNVMADSNSDGYCEYHNNNKNRKDIPCNNYCKMVNRGVD